MIKVYYHIYTSRHRKIGFMMVDNQIRKLKRSGLFDRAEKLFCIIVGPYANDIKELVELHGKFEILECVEQDTEEEYEGRTLKHLWRDAEPDDRILYFHTKGISYITGQNLVHGIINPRNLRAINGWRRGMEHFCIDEWRWQVDGLGAAYMTVGIMLLFHPFYMYGGNFWWAIGSHIRKQAEPIVWQGHDYAARQEKDSLDNDPRTISRMRHEQWLFNTQDGSYYHCLFNILDKPKDDEFHLCNSFWLYEDDMTPHVIRESRWINEVYRQNLPYPEV
ncbi:MAG: hypothetical protein EBT86_09640 [Actinobacteria bacterium]|nr:hypothetical protein [Actinomycetota bacterium]